MKKSILLTCIIFFLISCKNNSPDSFVLKGSIEGVDYGLAYLKYTIEGENQWVEIKDSAKIESGKFTFEGKTKTPSFATLVVNDLTFRFFVEPAKIQIKILNDSLNSFDVEGSKTQKEYELLFNEDLKALSKEFIHVQIKPDTSVEKKRVVDAIVKAQKEFIMKYTDSYIAPQLIRDLLFSKMINVKDARYLYIYLGDNLKNTLRGKEVDYYIKGKENTQIGSVAPDFSAPDMNGEIVKLFDYRGKYVLLDFWASWCTYCIEGMTHLKKIQEKYKDRNFAIIGISKDDNKTDWINSIEKYELNRWPQVSYVQSFEAHSLGMINRDDINQKYQVNGIPQYYLLDENGKIIGSWFGYSENNKQNMDKMLDDVFINK
ncbi:TlpA disulfide reductase family protein [uncultured Dysgonomonas sp.]|uniref:TlpA disulfide reductase family protein n=1 Tax=uncultured Dysgonomonas sp. TaxID=206096 RepID=UPI002804FB5D|nr:TlpA disulfide reductase family protein [uncultured Dysgonomonas sp.]